MYGDWVVLIVVDKYFEGCCVGGDDVGESFEFLENVSYEGFVLFGVDVVEVWCELEYE